MQVGTFLGYVISGILRTGSAGSTRISVFAGGGGAGAVVCVCAQCGWAAGDWAAGGVLWDGVFQRVWGDCERVVSDRVAGTAMGFAYNIGRVVSAAAPYLIGAVSMRAGMSAALCLTSVAFVGRRGLLRRSGPGNYRWSCDSGGTTAKPESMYPEAGMPD